MSELSEDAFQTTFTPPMKDVTSTADGLVDLWSYADPILETKYPGNEWDWRVRHIYESADGQFQHLLVPVPVTDAYLVFVIGVANREILGHRLLDLGKLYGTRA